MVSQLVKHTDIISALSTSIWVLSMVMVKLLSTHPTHARFAHVSRPAWSHADRCWHPWWSAGACHVRRMRCLSSLSSADFCHSSNTSASQSGILITVSPTVDSSLNETSLATKTSVQFGQGPSNCVALSLVNQSIASILVLAAASAWIDTVLCLEFGVEVINIYRFYVASNGILHLDAVPRVLKRNPLNTVVILSYY